MSPSPVHSSLFQSLQENLNETATQHALSWPRRNLNKQCTLRIYDVYLMEYVSLFETVILIEIAICVDLCLFREWAGFLAVSLFDGLI